MVRPFHKPKIFSRIANSVAAMLLFTLQVPFVVTGTAVAEDSSVGNTQSITSETLTYEDKDIYAKALDDHECNANEWHFIINQINDEANTPASILVTWENNDSETVELEKFTGGAAHYTTTSNLDSTVKSAKAEIYQGWSGQFNLSHGPCEEEEEDKGSIKIIKDAQPNDAQDFHFTTSGQGLSSFYLDDDSNGTLTNYKLFTELSKGTYSVTEGQTEGWDLDDIYCTYDADISVNGHTVTIHLGEGENVVCTFVNKKKYDHEEDKGSIKIIKDAKPNHHQDFSFTTTGSGTSNFSLDDDDNDTLDNWKKFDELMKGTYTFTEGHVDGWHLKDISCDAYADYDVDGHKLTIELKEGQHVVCTFVNEKEDDHEEGDEVTLCHATGSESHPFEKITVSAAGAYNGHLGNDHQNGEDIIPPFSFMGGVYSQNWDSEGQELYRHNCVKDDHEEHHNGSIKIVKDTQPDDAQDFHFTTTGQGLSNFYLDDDNDSTLSNSRSFTGLKAGTYTVSESEMAGWKLIQLKCSGGKVTISGNTAHIEIDDNDHVTCTFCNEKVMIPTTPPSTTTGGGGGGQVLGISTTPATKTLANTGAQPILNLIVGLSIVVLVTAVGFLNTRPVATRLPKKKLLSDTRVGKYLQSKAVRMQSVRTFRGLIKDVTLLHYLKLRSLILTAMINRMMRHQNSLNYHI